MIKPSNPFKLSAPYTFEGVTLKMVQFKIGKLHSILYGDMIVWVPGSIKRYLVLDEFIDIFIRNQQHFHINKEERISSTSYDVLFEFKSYDELVFNTLEYRI